jgi:hypothetical protein
MRKDSGSGFVTPFQCGPCRCGLCTPRDADEEYEALDANLRSDRAPDELRDAWDGSHLGHRGIR